MNERLILRVGGLADGHELLELGRELDGQQELHDIELVRADPADAWFSVNASSPELLTKCLRRLHDFNFDLQPHVGGVNAVVRDPEDEPAAPPASSTVEPSITLTPLEAEDAYTDQVILIAGPIRSFVQLNHFQESVRALPDVHEVRVRRFYRGTLYLAVQYDGVMPFERHIEQLKGFGAIVTAAAPHELVLTITEEPSGPEVAAS